MRIICCYASAPHPKTEEAIKKFAPDTEFVKVEGLFGYPEAIENRWTGESDLVVIESDKEITADVIPSFLACDEPWCTFKYKSFPQPYRREISTGLGCVKFSVEVQREVDTSEFICEDVPWQPCRLCEGKGCWRQLDARITMALENHCFDYPHVHGHIRHHHVYDDAWRSEHYKDVEYMMDTEARMKDIERWRERNSTYLV